MCQAIDIGRWLLNMYLIYKYKIIFLFNLDLVLPKLEKHETSLSSFGLYLTDSEFTPN